MNHPLLSGFLDIFSGVMLIPHYTSRTVTPQGHSACTAEPESPLFHRVRHLFLPKLAALW